MKKTQRTIIFTLFCIIACSAAAFAAGSSYTKQLTANYVGISLVVHGETVTPKDASGNIVDPFIVDGTTYLPVRAVAEALGEEVSWDGTTKTVYIGERPTTEPTPDSAVQILDSHELVILGNSKNSDFHPLSGPLGGFCKYNGDTYAMDGCGAIVVLKDSADPFGLARDRGWEWWPGYIFQGIVLDIIDDDPIMKGQAHTDDMANEELRNFKYEEKREYISRSEGLLCSFSLEHNGKIFESITGQNYYEAGLQPGDYGTWDSVEFFVDEYGYIVYNMNDLAEYFGISRRFIVECVTWPDEINLIIED